MTELERQLSEALRTLSAQFETEQRQHCAQVEALQQQIERQTTEGVTLRQRVERLSAQVTSLTEHCAALAESLRGLWR